MDKIVSAGWEYEQQARESGYQAIAGIDEAGRGPLAGPVVAAAVVLPTDFDCSGITDSKKLNASQRDSAFEKINNTAIAVGVGIIDSSIIDEINILQATHKAMKAALDDTNAAFDYVLVDGLPVPGLAKHCMAIVKGDSKSISIAAASIIAKVTRDRIMLEMDKLYPQYGFAVHKGYGTKDHLQAIARYGACPCHRLSFAPLKQEKSTCVLPGLELV